MIDRTYPRFVAAKRVLHGRVTETVVMDTHDANRVVHATGLPWSVRGRCVAQTWLNSIDALVARSDADALDALNRALDR